MTSTEMTTLLGLRMEDAGEVNFTSATKLSALNVAQRTVASFLNEHYLTELEVRDSLTTNNTAINNGYVTLGGGATNQTANIPIRNSIRNVEIAYSSGTPIFTVMIPFQDVKKLENSYLSHDSANPVSWVWAGLLYIRPMTAMTGLVVYYLKEPTDITSSANCILNASLHDMVVDLAEAELWRMDNNATRSQAARESGMNQIQVLNSRYETEKPTEVGA